MNFSFIQITDHHIGDTASALIAGFSPSHALQSVVRHIARGPGRHAEFIVATGDLVDHPSADSYQTLRQILNVQDNSAPPPGPLIVSMEGLLDIPMYLLPGNHDDRDIFYRFFFPESRPMALMNVAFIHKGIQFICLDWGPHTKAVAHPESLNFLVHSLDKDMPSIILMHHQLVKIGSRWLDDLIADDLEQFWKITTGKNILGIFSGHVHTTYERVVKGVPIFGLRSTAFPFVLQDEPLACLLPPHYRFVQLQDGILTSRVFEVPL